MIYFEFRYVLFFLLRMEVKYGKSKNDILTLNLKSSTGGLAYGMPVNDKYSLLSGILLHRDPLTRPAFVFTISLQAEIVIIERKIAKLKCNIFPRPIEERDKKKCSIFFLYK